VASLKELKGRINSVKSTQKITKAKQMVAAAKLRKAQAAAEAARPYAERLSAVMASLASKVIGREGAPKLLAGTGKDQRHLLVVANSDKGLAGAFNSNIVRAARRKAEELEAAGKTVKIYIAGKKGRVIRRFYPNNIVADPKFVNPAGKDYHLQMTSPARDAAVPSVGLTTNHDYDNFTRPATGSDIGAFEYH